MVSKVFRICDAYESGMGHGMNRDGFSKSPHADPEEAEAYEEGYQLGFERSSNKKKPKPTIVDMSELRALANQAFGRQVDSYFNGGAITDYDVLLHGAYGPAVSRLCNLVLQQYCNSNVEFPELKDESGIVDQQILNDRMNGPAAGTLRNMLFGMQCKAGIFSSDKTEEQTEQLAEYMKWSEAIDAAFLEIATRN